MTDTFAAAIGTWLLLVAMSSQPRFDAHDHRPREGGVVREVDGTDYELVVTPDAVRLFAREGGKPVDLSTAAATLTVTRMAERVRVAMSPVGQHIQARGNFRVAPGTVFIVTVMRPARTRSIVRYSFSDSTAGRHQ